MLWLRSFLTILRIELLMRFSSLEKLHRLVRKQAIGRINNGKAPIDEICHSVDLVCAFYPKQILCLQRSVATTLILKRNGWKAEMIIGVQLMPFNSHAWVEIDGIVVNDKPYLTEMYRVLERC
jgi:hypothetical protein